MFSIRSSEDLIGVAMALSCSMSLDRNLILVSQISLLFCLMLSVVEEIFFILSQIDLISS